LLGVHLRYGFAHLRRHQFVTRYTEGFSHFVASIAAPVASGWSVRRWDLHWKAPPFHGTHTGSNAVVCVNKIKRLRH
jgi:hypothetical protein